MNLHDCKLQINVTMAGLLERLEPGADARNTLTGALERLMGLVLEGNRTMNLTGDGDPALFSVRHIEDALSAAVAIDSVVAAERIERGDAWRIADVGSGAGIPGLVWALVWPEASVRLVESRGRRAGFLDRTVRELNLERVAVLDGRVEDWARDSAHREAYDLVTARALAALPVALEWTLPLTRPGGWAAIIQTAGGSVDAGRAPAMLGAAPDPPQRIAYDRSDGKQCEVCLFSKVDPTPEAYPRAAGRASKRPLG